MTSTPLCVLDLVPVPSGSTAPQAIRNSIDLARHAEEFGYARYWFAEHHLNPGVAGTSPALMLAFTAPATTSIRLGSGAVQMGHRTPLSVVEEFGLLDAMYPGRFDLGIGRSGGKVRRGGPPAVPAAPQSGPAAGSPAGPPAGDEPRQTPARLAPTGLTIPRRFDPGRLRDSPLAQLGRKLLTQPGAEPPDYTQQVDDILALMRGTYPTPADAPDPVAPAGGSAIEIWVLGSSGGESAQAAGERGLRFAANYHVSPATVLEAADGYRAAFRPSAELARPYVSVSADVVVAKDEASARELAAGYGMWVRSIRTGRGAIEFPSPEQARGHRWTSGDRELVADRVDTQFTGSPAQVADQLERLRDATGADELIVTTITHDHSDRVRSYELLAEEWQRR
jgi:luciferase family oxidoreductase group 1